jgi:hypothetical protein
MSNDLDLRDGQARQQPVLSPSAAFIAVAQRALAEIADSSAAAISDADLEAVLTAAVKLYAARAELRPDPPPPLSGREITPTEVVVVASEMLRVVDLNPFDLSMWYRRAR